MFRKVQIVSARLLWAVVAVMAIGIVSGRIGLPGGHAEAQSSESNQVAACDSNNLIQISVNDGSKCVDINTTCMDTSEQVVVIPEGYTRDSDGACVLKAQDNTNTLTKDSPTVSVTPHVLGVSTFAGK